MTANPTPKNQSLALLTAIAAHLEALREELKAYASTLEALTINPPPGPAPAGPSPDGFVDFHAETIVMTTNDQGEPRYKIKGGRYHKYGVFVWPEVLPALGIDPASLQPGPNPFADHVRALLNGNGQPKKVIGLANHVDPPEPTYHPPTPPPVEEDIPF